MTADFIAHPTLESALNDRYRGHDTRDWSEWNERHAYGHAVDIPDDADKAMIACAKGSCAGLGSKKNLRHLIVGKVDQAALEAIAMLEGLVRLELEWPVLADDLSPLRRLDQLRFLSLDTPRKVADFSGLAQMPSLRTLFIENARHLAAIDWLQGADHLEVIGVEGAIDTNQTIASLAPLAGLKGLTAFFGTSLRVLDGDLAPFVSCPKLKFLGIARFAKKPAFDALREKRPDIHCNWFDDRSWLTAGVRPR